ncbi:carbohydrate ABC transporter permease [Schleiferilactobacillus harbinensis]|jgi:ABC-type sugar transport system permease subunit|uniref:carbohydrate ABC transporter permease n=1 Tax=Schleiferilactobacillus harbinensis TaxID=304207 RepID=UPI0021A4A815|nr:sugar ABC transporter permease [Schleiferilactobacillus harbinensis]MCI1687184.1 sugar ABC transporter permease [Schleiferilactobacillus harbinensis]MCI1783500.1 sugar ABC transporter permease [Schleiferilactobacillus harbinensis]MCI1849963.1 sugar ABC transporter permease [Schleiferilactobacillus harbinensis]MCT2909677.1 sugar ABC transporter permease [Schleiferilactobacillus harbinensis]
MHTKTIKRQFNAFLIPILLIYAALTLYPLIQSFVYSLSNFDGYSMNFHITGFANYGRVFHDPSMTSALIYTLLYTIGTTALITCLAIPLAVILDKKFFGNNFVRSAFFFPSVPSALLLGFVWGFLLNPLGSGAINAILHTIGLGPIPWLSETGLARLSTILVATWQQTGWHTLIYLAYLQSIPEDFYEAAELEGANSWQIFIHITLPQLMPAMTVSVMLLLTGGLKVYDLPFALTTGGPGYSTYTITQAVIQRGIAEGNFGLASALSIVFFLLVMIVTVIQQLLMRHGEEQINS